jgi:mannose-1-phosphate guanylyltransferase
MALAGVVLCAGLGTRLRPLTELVPKPAVPLCQVPLIRHALGLLAGVGIRRVVVNVHHRPEAMAAAAGAAAAELGVELAISREPVIAGTGGALREAAPLLGGAEAVVVLNGDVLFDVDLRAALAAHQATGALATLALLPMPAGARYAAVELDEGGRVRRIAGRFGPGGDRLTPWHFPGLYVVAPELLARIPAAPFECDVHRDLYPPLMARGLVRGLITTGAWRDLGTPESYLAANLEVAAGGVDLARFGLPAARRIAASARISPGAQVGEAVVIGEGCLVPDGARVDRAVLWAGTRLREGEVLVDAIAAGELRVAAGPAPAATRR